MSDILSDVQHGVGLITLNRPRALNALSLSMVRELTDLLLKWREDPAVQAVAIRGSNKEGVFGAFCAGGTSASFTRRPCRVTQRWKIFSPRSTRSTTSSITTPSRTWLSWMAL